MRRAASALVIPICLLLTLAAIRAQQSSGDQPAKVDQTEKVQVDLMLIDVVVMDKKDRAVAGLASDAFQMTVEGQPVSIDTFDVSCPEGGLDEPTGTKGDKPRPPQLDLERKIVFAVDYNHLRLNNRAPVLEQAQWMVSTGKTSAEEIMIVSIADGLRIEQPFSRSKGQAVGTLNRMEHDVTLWGREFGQGVTGKSYFDSLSTLMDVMAQYDGAKSVVLFSELGEGGSRDWDLWYSDVAQRAANAQAKFYTVSTFGLGSGSAGGLVRLANESGGRHTQNTNDLSLGYARAQRDMSCRYTLGHYLKAGEGRVKKSVRVTIGGEDQKNIGQLRYPEQIRIWTDKELLESTLRAAHADPGPFDTPLIRSFVYPVAPASASSWNAMVAVNFELPMQPGGVDVDVSATLLTGTAVTREYKGSRFHVDPAPGAQADKRMVTMQGEGKVDPGDHRLTLVLSRAGIDQKPHTSQVMFTLPDVPQKQLFVNGPFLARAVPDGVLIRAQDSRSAKSEGPSPLEQIIGPGATFEPLFVYRIAPDDMLLVAWSACIVDGQFPADATVERKVLDDAGNVVRELDAKTLATPDKGKVLCRAELDSLPGGALGPGEYTISIVARDGAGKELLDKTVPLLVERAASAGAASR